MTKKYAIIIFIILAGLGAVFLSRQKGDYQAPATIPSTSSPALSNSAEKESAAKNKVLINVPFTSQAPTGNWSDPRQEDGCEEASVLMAWLWLQGKTITATEAEKTIIAMSEFQLARYGSYHDTNAVDTAKFMKDYYGYEKVSVEMNPSIEDIKSALLKNHIVLVPMNGQRLNNPYFKQPGPTTHMLVIKGFDESKGIFITNDPGTKRGESYTYTYQTVYNAMVDYPTGDHGSQEGRPKSIIVIEK
ncbi:MAG: hypothetical protein EPN92_11965 [Chitinophagaceae bacterium]|nr:MAG: hypothetical protein EPN92_11965 [Chitinophagaceae bacterium]